MNTIKIIVLSLLLVTEVAQSQHTSTGETDAIKIGIIADCQYADQPTQGVRHYRLSPQKLSESVDRLNTQNLDHVFHLGDFIDKDRKSFETVLPIIQRLEAPVTHVLGNHDFSVADAYKEEVPGVLGLKGRYFTVKIKDWKFIVLDGNDISLYAWPKESQQYKQALEIYQDKYSSRETWNGGIGDNQLSWLKTELEQSETNSEKVILLCHFPVLPVDNHVLWNHEEVLNLIKSYSCVKAWLNGHNHAGGYAEDEGVHFLTFKGMVDTEETSYATIDIQGEHMVINGFGREEDRDLKLR